MCARQRLTCNVFDRFLCYAELLQRIKQLTSAIETVSNENQLLRQQCGIADTAGLDLTDVKLAKVTLPCSLLVACAAHVPAMCACVQPLVQHVHGTCLAKHRDNSDSSASLSFM